ncbi:MAG: NADH:ubiquinone reductase (Na(+)-transporting) subunit D [Shewanella psychromarinicola]|jgi:Na+-transporting NADH:ubiquinone oxidoreductase subunit D|uniref:Na(+)-translocating NADH-quinone reductase subunit D n=1 Tax=Shewanella psychromarinicola TaxID=2487742 RepID=A0A3N4DPV8_9GAMM|nr:MULTISPECIES: NADH:ubiquinone reductase (Na(+)-transporting) subunit D [Shewanella]AZG33640.1 NADH:ubiquinone reductase (Na(+)-transporting) subunit D [Shewanella psychromarinicola]MCL1082133.1 NADH:ubiquinone reductase (Na(+)-transporting) subunit D [Shewanella psychromarinicola]PKG78698.1 NADH:ubiquinone reductase (Na(+)-transporting) subunit D [Shewanella sp. Actino-trap-3]RPA27939.1 NADH:ubiquinone reductase (Na(+)-transporting) subunit D [Shewanella psychromarinicola]|tara:strand:- start:60924 stop:61544 length:621 start_codon:yes stop_codon:yes gene_type:complete
MSNTTSTREILTSPIFANNPVAMQVLGVCSALAVSNSMQTAFVMTLAVTFVLVFSNLIISSIRHFIPNSVRIIAQMTVIASLVIIVDMVLQDVAYELSKQLSVFVSLIITNCIIMGRAEAFAMKHPPHLAVFDALGNALGYGVILMGVAFIRELLGRGSLFGHSILTTVENGGWYLANEMFTLPPSAFFIIGVMIWVIKIIQRKRG